jgi:hypothetical protein
VLGVERVGLDHLPPASAGMFDGGFHECRRDALPTVSGADVETRDRRHAGVVDPRESPVLVECREGAWWCQLTPTHGKVTVEGEDPRRRTVEDDIVEVLPILAWLAPTVGGADSPVHAPATANGTGCVEQIL